MNNDWYQLQLTPPDVLQVNIRLGLVPSTNHAQVLAELIDPTTGIQLAQASKPHDRLDSWPSLLEWATAKADDWLRDALEPF